MDVNLDGMTFLLPFFGLFLFLVFSNFGENIEKRKKN